MRIAIDALGIGQPGGGRSATLNLLEGLFKIDHENEYVIVTDDPQAIPRPAGAHVRNWVLPLRNRFAARLWAQFIFPFAVRGQKIDIVHFARSQGVLGFPYPHAVTIYDLTVLEHPEIYPAVDVLYWRLIQPAALRQADKVIAISQDVARDIRRRCDVAPERLQVIYAAYHPRFQPQPAEKAQAILAKYGLTPPVILHVGSISRKKNLVPLVEAIARLRQRGIEVTLALVGRYYGRGRDRELEQLIEAERPNGTVCLTGPVPDEDLPALYTASTLLAFPSLHEGFGIVPLEAMACGLPVVSSTGVVQEVAGKAVWTVSRSEDATAWAETLEMLLNDAHLRSLLREQGLARAKEYSIERTAQQTLQLYEKLAR